MLSDVAEARARRSRAARRRGAGRRTPRRRFPLAMGLPDASGAFVTLKRRGSLRGCLGTLQCSRGLAAEVARCAAEAASEDPRFPPVRSDELRRPVRRSVGSRPARTDRPGRSVGHHDRPSRPRRRTGRAARPAAAAGRDRMGLDHRAVPPPDVREGGPPGRRLAARRAHLPLRSGSVWREVRTGSARSVRPETT